MADETPKPILIGTGMPASILLDAFGSWLHDAFGETAYQVGSSIHGKTWRDVDIRIMLDDDEFDAMFPGCTAGYNQQDAKWALICAAVSALAKAQTGLPVDFQFQRVSDANQRYAGPRQPLALYAHHNPGPDGRDEHEQ